MQISWSEIEPTLGQITSQEELFDAVGVELPLRGEQMRRYKAQVRRLLERGQRLGAVDLLP